MSCARLDAQPYDFVENRIRLHGIRPSHPTHTVLVNGYSHSRLLHTFRQEIGITGPRILREKEPV
jgi:hypothetical protein